MIYLFKKHFLKIKNSSAKKLYYIMPAVLWFSFFTFQPLAEPVDSCGFRLSQGQSLRWNPSAFPVAMSAHKSVPELAYRNFVSAMEHWNRTWTHFLTNQNIKPFPLFKAVHLDSQKIPAPEQADNHNTLFFVGEKDIQKYFQSDSIAQVSFTKTESLNRSVVISSADILINSGAYELFFDQKFAMNESKSLNKLVLARLSLWKKARHWLLTFLNNPESSVAVRQVANSSRVPRDHYDFPTLILGELGAVLGLAVAPEGVASAVNQERLYMGAFDRSITEYDLKNLFCAYIK